jgi:hypothetical protein
MAAATDSTNADRVVTIGVAAATVVVAAQISAQLIDFWALGLRIVALDSNQGDSIFGRIESLAVLGSVSALVVFMRRSGATAVPLLLTAATGWLFVDNVSKLHEGAPAWVLITYAALLAFTAIGFWQLSTPFAPRVRRLLRMGLLLLGASLAIHRLGPHALMALGYGRDGWEYQVKVALKEATQVGGWILVTTGVAAAAVRPLRRG